MSIKKCFESYGYSLNETALKIHGEVNSTIKATLVQGFVHFLQPAQGSIRFTPNPIPMKQNFVPNTISLDLNHSLTYYVAFVDPKFQLILTHPTAIPQTFIKIQRNSGISLVYLKVGGK